MTGIGSVMIERYLRERRYRFFRSDDGEYLVFISSQAGQFPVYMLSRSSDPNVVTLRARTQAQFPHAERGRLLEWVNRWNDKNPWLTASVRPTTDGSRLRVVGHSPFFVVVDSEFPVLRRFADLAFAAALKLFEAVRTELVVPSPAQLEAWFAG